MNQRILMMWNALQPSIFWLVLLLATLPFTEPALAQPHDADGGRHDAHKVHSDRWADRWEGSPQGKAYSEFNHHLAGALVLLMALAELQKVERLRIGARMRYALPMALVGAGGYLLVWSDHDAWPIGSRSFVQTFFSGDIEIVQHKLYALFFLGVGGLEVLRRTGLLRDRFWLLPLPVLAILAGTILFLHVHGDHLEAHKIALNHMVLGTLAIAAGSCKLVGLPRRGQTGSSASRWELAWVGLIALIGLQLLLYAE